MLNEKNVEAALGLAMLWAQQNRVARPKAATPLAELNNSITMGMSLRGVDPATVQGWEDDPASYTKAVLAAATADLSVTYTGNKADAKYTPSNHTNDLVGCTDRIAAGLQKQVYTARNVVAPIVNDFTEKVDLAIASVSAQSMSGMDITVNAMPEFARDPRFESALRDYAGTPFTSVGATPGLPEMNVSEILELIKTGMVDLDGELSTFIRSQGIEQVRQVFDWTFKDKALMLGTEPQPSGYGNDMSERLLNDQRFGMVNSMIMYCLAVNLFDNPPKGVNVSLETYNQRMAVIRGNAGARLFNHLAVATDARNRGQVVAGYYGKTVIVFKDSYDAFLEAGGKVEVILGAILSTERPYLANQLLERSQELTKLWESHLASMHLDARIHRINTMKKAAYELVRDWMVDNGINEQQAATRLGKLESLLGSMAPTDFDDTSAFALCVVCDILFEGSSAKRILSQMVQIGKDNPDMDPANLAMVAYLDYLIDWVCSMIEVREV